MYEIITASGTHHRADMCGAADGCLHIFLTDGGSFLDVVEEFLDSDNTGTITYKYGEMQTVHEGYTVLISVLWDGDGRYSIMLKKANT